MFEGVDLFSEEVDGLFFLEEHLLELLVVEADEFVLTHPAILRGNGEVVGHWGIVVAFRVDLRHWGTGRSFDLGLMSLSSTINL